MKCSKCETKMQVIDDYNPEHPIYACPECERELFEARRRLEKEIER